MVRLILLTALGMTLVGCASDSTVLADVEWTLACPSEFDPGETCTGLSLTETCLGTSGRQVHQFDAATVCDGQDLVRATCSASRSGGNLSLNLGVTVSRDPRTGDNYAFEVDRLLVNSAGAIQDSPACDIRIAEDQLDYVGRCGATAPSEAQPCQIASISITGRTIDAEVLCDKIVSEIPNEIANIRGPGARNAARLHFENCEGL